MANDFATDRAPPTVAHRTIGMLNVSFAGVMLLCGICSGASLLMQVAMAPISAASMKSMQDAMHAEARREHEKRLVALEAEAAAATDAADKARISAAREALERQGPLEVEMPDMLAIYRDPRFLGYVAADCLSGLALNAAMLVSGIGLIAAKNWARKLALWVAGLKIARLVLVYGFAIAVVVPLFAAMMGEMMEKTMSSMPQRAGGPPPAAQFGQGIAMFYGFALSAGAVLMMLVGMIYPLVMLWVLTRPKVKAACGDPTVARSPELS